LRRTFLAPAARGFGGICYIAPVIKV
jgi:hypothetical protein